MGQAATEAKAADGDFVGLVEELEDIERRRTGSGNLDSESAVRRAHVERRVLELLTGERPDEARRAAARVRCDLLLRVVAGPERSPGAVKELAPGGILVETSLKVASGQTVDLEIGGQKGGLEHAMRLRAVVLRAVPGAPGRPATLELALPMRDEASERRMRRFLLEVARSRLSHW